MNISHACRSALLLPSLLVAVACGVETSGTLDVEPQPASPAATPGAAASPAPAGGTIATDTGSGAEVPLPSPVEPPPSAGGVVDGGGVAPSCAPVIACPTGLRDIGAVSGDVGSESVVASGTTSELLKVRITEGSLGAAEIKARLTLTSPPGANYDLFVYYDEKQNSAAHVECKKLKGKAAELTPVDALTARWSDQRPVGGRPDSTNITVEVRFVSGTCAPADPWTLRVDGNIP